jgi:hypothetical protein
LIAELLSDVRKFPPGGFSERRMRTFLSVAAGLTLTGFPAFAQAANLADALAKDASCVSVAEARQSLERAIAAAPADTPPDAIVSALYQIVGRDDVCAPAHEAARALAEATVAAAPALADRRLASESSAIVAATLAEAERRAANLKFEVGPPPRFMTRERKSGP